MAKKITQINPNDIGSGSGNEYTNSDIGNYEDAAGKNQRTHGRENKAHHRFETERQAAPGPRRKKSSPVLIAIIVVAACVFIFAGYKLISTLGKYKAASNTYSKVESIFETKEGTEEDDAPFVWDYNSLLSVNSEAVGWIYCKGVLSYPIVQSFDSNGNSKYLYNLIDGTPNDCGTLFVDTNQPEGLNGVYSIIYGHNMNDGSMFGSLQKYNRSDDSYYKEHPTMDIYIAENHYVYNVVAAFTTPVDSFVYNYSITDDEAYNNFVNTAKANSLYAAYTGEIAANSNIVTLSTCTPDNSDTSRFVVILVRDHIVE